MLNKLLQYFYLMRFHKPIGILLLLWPTLWAVWLAGEGNPSGFIIFIFVSGVIVMRAAGCIINDIADRHFDRFVERTRDRPLTAGKVSVREALILFLILMFFAFLLVLNLNRYAIFLAFVGAGMTVFYPYMKRFTHLPQLGLGIAFAWGVPMAFAAQLNQVTWGGWELFLAAAIWPVIYDTQYAMVDLNDDVKIGLKSTAILFGKHDRLILFILQLVFLLLLLHIGFIFNLNSYYFYSLILVAGLGLYQQFLMKNRDRTQCFKAFLNNNWIGLFIFVGIILQ